MKKLFILVLTLLAAVPMMAQQIDKNSTGMKEVCEFLKGCGYYFLATTEDDQPRVRPFGTAIVFENRLYIQTGRSKSVASQMVKNPRIEICAYNSETNVWIRISATVVDDSRREVKEAMLSEYPSLKTMYSADDENTMVLYLKDATATFYSLSGDMRIVNF